MSIKDALITIGSMDIEFIDEMIETWGFDENKIADEAMGSGDGQDANHILYCIAMQIVEDYELDEEYFDYYLNCLDTHFYYHGEGFTDPKDLEEIIKEYKK